MKIFGEYDVVVVGGGTSGVIAGVSSARQGAKTLVIELNGFLGGTLTAGLIHQIMTFHDSNGNRVVGGIAQEIIEKLQSMKESTGHVGEQQGHLKTATPFDIEAMKLVSQRMLKESGTDILLHTMVTDVLIENNKIRGVIIENKSGRSVVLAKNVIDSSGDADVVALGNIPFKKAPKNELQPASLVFRLGNVDEKKMIKFMRKNHKQFKFASDVDLNKFEGTPYSMNSLAKFKPWQDYVKEGKVDKRIVIDQAWFATSGGGIGRGEINVNVVRLPNIDGTDAVDLSKSEIDGREMIPSIVNFFRKYFPGFENCFLMDSASYIGVRETRRIDGEYTLTKDDIISGQKFEDKIGLSACPVDVHQPNEEGEFTWIKTSDRGSIAYEIPYRILLPKDYQGIIVAGRTVSATQEALGSTRLMGTCFVTGHAAGVAAALSAKENVSLQKLNINKLQDALIDQDAILDL